MFKEANERVNSYSEKKNNKTINCLNNQLCIFWEKFYIIIDLRVVTWKYALASVTNNGSNITFDLKRKKYIC